MNISSWGIWRSFNSVGDYIAAAFCLLCVFVVFYTIHYSFFRRWSCKSCGKQMVGDTDPLTGLQATTHCGECCGWRRISHAEYNREFGVQTKIIRIK